MTAETTHFQLVTWAQPLDASPLRLTTLPKLPNAKWESSNRISVITDSDAVLDDIFVTNNDRHSYLATALLHSGMLWAYERGRRIVRATFIPIGNEDRIRNWYEHRGIFLDSDNTLIGDVETVVGLCGEMLAQHGVNYSLHR